jgi:hypothetical protein
MPCDVKHFNVAVESGTSLPTLTAPILQFAQSNKRTVRKIEKVLNINIFAIR